MSANATTQPVNEGEELTVTIEAVGEKGDGICKKKGFILFVPKTTEGEVCKIRVTKVLSKVGFAEVIERLDAQAAKPSQPQEQTNKYEYVAPAPAKKTAQPAKEGTEDFGAELTLEEEDDSFADEFDTVLPEDAPKQTEESNKTSQTGTEDKQATSSAQPSIEDEVPKPGEDPKKKVMVEEPDDVIPEP